MLIPEQRSTWVTGAGPEQPVKARIAFERIQNRFAAPPPRRQIAGIDPEQWRQHVDGLLVFAGLDLVPAA